MINEVTDSLEAFLTQTELPTPLNGAAIRFERPTDPYSLDQTTVNLFLYEVKENLELRSNEPTLRRENGHSFVVPPPYRATCTYLVTAWPVDGADLPKQEHKLLGQVWQLFARTPTIPAAFLTPALQSQEPPLPMVLLQPDGVRNPAEFWAAIGNRIKPSLLLSVTVGLEVFEAERVPNVITSEIRLSGEAPFFRIAGTVVDAAIQPVANASVRLVELGRSTLTDNLGRFSLSPIAAGTLTLRVTAGTVTQDRPITVPVPLFSNYDVQLT